MEEQILLLEDTNQPWGLTRSVPGGYPPIIVKTDGSPVPLGALSPQMFAEDPFLLPGPPRHASECYLLGQWRSLWEGRSHPHVLALGTEATSRDTGTSPR